MKALLGLALLLAFFGRTYSNNVATSYYCSPNANSQQVGTLPGRVYVTCVCNSGYCGNGSSCYPVVTGTTAKCCVPGSTTWNAATKTCDDVNECSSPTLNKCAPQSSCTNVQTNYLCSSSRTLVCSPGTSACDGNTDCVNLGGTIACVDPCDSANHQTIDGSTRLSSTTSTGVFQTDRYLFGWYRYTGNSGVLLQEGCTGPVKCGSALPYTLPTGSHPPLGAGIQTVTLLENFLSSCNESSSILIKACPDVSGATSNGFYVYKFLGLISFNVYCTDPLKTPQTVLPVQTTTTATTTATATTSTTATTQTPTTTTEATTTELTTQQTSTETIATTTVEPSTAVPSTLESSTIEPSTLEPFTFETSTFKPSTPESTPSTVQSSTTEPSTAVPSTSEPSTVETSTLETTFVPSTTEHVEPTSPVVPKPTVTIIQTETENKVKTTTESRNVNNIIATIVTTEETTKTTTFVTVKSEMTTNKTTVISSSCRTTIITIDTHVNVETRNTTDPAHVANYTSSFNDENLELPSRPFIQEPVSTTTTTATTTDVLDSGTRTTTITTTVTKQKITQLAYV